MLKTLRFKNFKSWSDANIQCGKITGLFGTNSSGKTSVIQFLLMLKQTKDATDRGIALDLNGDLVSLGTISDVIHDHDESLPLRWRISFALDGNLSVSDPSDKRSVAVARGNELSVDVRASVHNKAPIATELTYRLGNMSFSLAQKKDQATQFDLKASAANESDESFHFVRTKGRAWQLPGPIKSYAFPDQARTYFQNAGFLADLEASYEAQLDNIFYLGPLREYPQRDYLWARSRPSDVGRRGEKAIDAILAATEANETRNLLPRDGESHSRR